MKNILIIILSIILIIFYLLFNNENINAVTNSNQINENEINNILNDVYDNINYLEDNKVNMKTLYQYKQDSIDKLELLASEISYMDYNYRKQLRIDEVLDVLFLYKSYILLSIDNYSLNEHSYEKLKIKTRNDIIQRVDDLSI